MTDSQAVSPYSKTLADITSIKIMKILPDKFHLIVVPHDEFHFIIIPYISNPEDIQPRKVHLAFKHIEQIAVFEHLRLVAFAGAENDLLSLISLDEMACVDPLAESCFIDSAITVECVDGAIVDKDSCRCIPGYFNTGFNTCSECQCAPCENINCNYCNGPT